MAVYDTKHAYTPILSGRPGEGGLAGYVVAVVLCYAHKLLPYLHLIIFEGMLIFGIYTPNKWHFDWPSSQ